MRNVTADRRSGSLRPTHENATPGIGKDTPGKAVPWWVRVGQWIFTVGVVAGFLGPIAAFLGVGPADWSLEGSFPLAVGALAADLPRYIPEAGAGQAPYGTVLLILAAALLTAGAALMARYRWLFPGITAAGAVTVIIMAWRRSEALASFGKALTPVAVDGGDFLQKLWFGAADPPEPVTAAVLAFIVTAAFARYAVQLARGRRRWEWALLLGALPYFNLWLYGEIQTMIWWFAAFAGCMLLLAAGTEGLAMASRGTPQGARPFPMAATWSQAVAFIIITALVATALPAEGSPRSWHWLNEQVQRIIPFAARGPGGGFGGLSSLGNFGGLGGAPGRNVQNLSDMALMLGGPFQAAETELMEVDVSIRKTDGTAHGLWAPDAGAGGTSESTRLLQFGDYELPPTLYMRGLTHTDYNGLSWRPGEQVSRELIGPDGPALAREEAGEQLFSRGRFLVAINQRVRLLNLSTDVLFYTGMAFADPSGGYRQTAGGGIIADNILRPSMVYSVPGYLPQAVPGGLDPGHPESPLDIVRDHEVPHLPRFKSLELSPEELAEYLHLPDTVPARVHSLATELTADAGDAFLAARGIEAYLRRFPYETDVPFPPADQDFVDHFLFDLQQGYCTHYASAMVVMLRSVGIPARLAHGFIVPTDGAGPYTVTAAQAHVWPEAFIPGFGWAEFEPTAAYPSSVATWASSGLGLATDDAPGVGDPGGSLLDPDEIERPTDDEFRLPTGVEIEHTPEEAPGEEQPAPGRAPAAAGGVAAAAALAVAALAVWIAHARRRRLPADPAEAAIKAYGLTRLYVGGAMAAMDPPQREGPSRDIPAESWSETLTAGEFLHRVEHSLPALVEPVADLTEIYEPALFGRLVTDGAGFDAAGPGGGESPHPAAPSAVRPELILQEIVHRLASRIGWWRAAAIQAFPNSPGIHRVLFRR